MPNKRWLVATGWVSPADFLAVHNLFSLWRPQQPASHQSGRAALMSPGAPLTAAQPASKQLQCQQPSHAKSETGPCCCIFSWLKGFGLGCWLTGIAPSSITPVKQDLKSNEPKPINSTPWRDEARFDCARQGQRSAIDVFERHSDLCDHTKSTEPKRSAHQCVTQRFIPSHPSSVW